MTRNKQKYKAMEKELQNTREKEIREALEQYRLPWITRAFKKAWFICLRYTFAPVFVLLCILFIVYNSISGYTDAGDVIWLICKAIILFYIFGIGGFAVTSLIFEIASVRRLCRRLDITHDEMQYYVVIYQIKGM